MIAGCQQPGGPLAPPRAFGYLGPTELASGYGKNGRRYLTMTQNGCQHNADHQRDSAARQAVVGHIGAACPYGDVPAGCRG